MPLASATAPTASVVVPVHPRGRVDVVRTLAPLRHGPGDPAFRLDGYGGVWRACDTPDGPVTAHIGPAIASSGEVTASLWGPGTAWLEPRVADLLGARDDTTGFVLGDHPVLTDSARRNRGWRLTRTGLVLDTLVPVILEQKVTSSEAHRSWRELLVRHGTPAPGPAPAGLRIAPDAARLALVPSWEWHRAGVGPQRAAAIVRAAKVADRLEAAVAEGTAELDRRLRSIPGIGEWTSAEVRQRVCGDSDAVSVGDFHLAHLVGWALTGRRVDDAGMVALLEPWRGHRHRVTRLIELSGRRQPRYGPRYAGRDYRGI